MKLTRCRIGLLAVLICICIAGMLPVRAQESGPQLTLELLQNRIAAVEGSTDLDEVAQARLVDLYRQTINNLEIHRANEAAAHEYRESGRLAPAATEALRSQVERRRSTAEAADLRDPSSWSSRELIRSLDEESANFTAIEATLAVLEARLETSSKRPAAARASIATARARLEELLARNIERPAAGETPQVTQAVRWANETLVEALRAEISMLDQELLTHSARRDLLQAQRDEATLAANRAQARLEILRAAVSDRRRHEAEQAIGQARDALAGASSRDPLVRKLAEDNLALVQTLQEQIIRLDEVSTQHHSRVRAAEVDRAFRNARRKLQLKRSRMPVGLTILAERGRFPRVERYTAERRLISQSIVDLSLRLMELEEEFRGMGDVDAVVDRRVAESGAPTPDESTRSEMVSLVQTRRSLLERAVANDTVLQRRLHELDDALRRMEERTRAYDDFLAERMLWVRSHPAFDGEALKRLPGEVVAYIQPSLWQDAATTAIRALSRSPLLLLMVLLAVGLGLGRGRIKKIIKECGREVECDHEFSTGRSVKAVAFTLLLVAPVPLLLGALGWALFRWGDAALFPRGVGSAMLRTAAWITLPILMRALFLPGGVAACHLGWDEDYLGRLRRHLTWFIGLLFPVYFVMRTSLVVEPPAYAGGTLTLFCFLALNLILLALLFGIAHPTRGAGRDLTLAKSEGAGLQWCYLLFALLAALPVGLGLLAWSGYSYTAQELTKRSLLSLWALAALWLAAALTQGWLQMMARQLSRQGAPGTPETLPALHRGVDGIQLGESWRENDLNALGDDSRQLLRAAVLLMAVLALAAIWSDVIPALGLLEEVHLWNHAQVIAGIEQIAPVTLLDLLLAVVIGAGGLVLARNLPSLLDIILMKQGSMSVGGRYTVGTLTRYTITAITVMVALNLVGANASQLGWAAAALGFGIGFGLQEIVANFICGLILLFERPVRIGDVVTIGDASGIVAKIHIRATTIRDWEQKELVVPNKELITGRLLNWTLSDAVTRVFITVGVAYGSDVELAMGLIREAARENALVIEDPEPRVHFEQFGDSSLHLTLRAYTREVADRLPVTTELHQAIDHKFRTAGIVIAFPQRDIHFYSEGEGGSQPDPGEGSSPD